MVKHVVMFRLQGDEAECRAAALAFKEAIEALPAVIEPLQRVTVGLNENPAEQWHIVLIADLPTLADVALYSQHPAHLAAASLLTPVKSARACVDFTY